MKIGEVWKYKNWVCSLMDENSEDTTEGFSLGVVRIEITNLRNGIVWFREFSAEDSEYSIKREAFVQIFEKVYED